MGVSFLYTTVKSIICTKAIPMGMANINLHQKSMWFILLSTITAKIFVNIIPKTINIWLNEPSTPLNYIGENYFINNGHIELYKPTHNPCINLPKSNVGKVDTCTNIAPTIEIPQTKSNEFLKY